MMAYNDLAHGSYCDFSQFCRDYALNDGERRDVRTVLAKLRTLKNASR